MEAFLPLTNKINDYKERWLGELFQIIRRTNLWWAVLIDQTNYIKKKEKKETQTGNRNAGERHVSDDDKGINRDWCTASLPNTCWFHCGHCDATNSQITSIYKVSSTLDLLLPICHANNNFLLVVKYRKCFERWHFKGQAISLLLSNLCIIILSFKLFICSELTQKGSTISSWHFTVPAVAVTSFSLSEV